MVVLKASDVRYSVRQSDTLMRTAGWNVQSAGSFLAKFSDFNFLLAHVLVISGAICKSKQ